MLEDLGTERGEQAEMLWGLMENLIKWGTRIWGPGPESLRRLAREVVWGARMGRMGGQAVKGDAGEAKGDNRGRGLGGAPRAGGLGRKDGGGRGSRSQPSWQQWSSNRSYLCSRREGLWLQGSCGIGAGAWGGAHRMAAWAWLG